MADVLSPVWFLLLIAGVSEAAGRLLPVVARRPGISRGFVVGLLLTGAFVEAAVIALWPLTAGTVAELLLPAPMPEAAAGLRWSPGLLAPLLLAAILAFPLLGPLLHLLLLAGVGSGLAGALATATGLGWGTAASCVVLAGGGLAVAVEALRRLVAAIIATGTREPSR